MNTTLHLTRGLPGSGKSTYAREWVAGDPEHRARLNRDDIRAMIHTTYSGYVTERAVSIIQHNAANGLLRKGIDVIVDDTNLTARFVRDWMRLAERQGATVEFHDQFLDVPLDECIARDAARPKPVGETVIRSMHDRYLTQGPPPIPELVDSTETTKPYTGTPGAHRTIIVDIDGTLALNTGGRSPFDWGRVGEDDVNNPVADLVSEFASLGYDIVLMSGRDETCRDLTLDWLERHDIADGNNSTLFMRSHGDNRKDAVVKLELFDAHVRDHFDVRYVIDDRNQVVAAWRSIGLPVLQVADGNF